MPQVEIAIEAFAAWIEAGSFWAKVVWAVMEAAAAYGIGMALRGKLPTGSLNGGNPLQLSRGPVDPRRVIYGKTRVAGTLVFAHCNGTNNENLRFAMTLAGHECDGIEQIYFNDITAQLDWVGNLTGDYAGYGSIQKHLGADDQVADADLVDGCLYYWTSNHRLRGICYLAGHLVFSQEKFPAGQPNPTAVVRGRKVFDPRTQATAWSDNPALAVRDYLTNATFGMGVAIDEIDDASFIAAANVCDEVVSLPGGTTEKRYTCNGCFELSVQPSTVIEQLCGSMAGWAVYIGGRWICHAGAYTEPAITLDEDDLRAGIDVQTKASMRDTCNGVKGTFASPADKWQPADFPAVQDSAAVAEDGVPIWRDLDLGFTTSAFTAQRLATIELKRTRLDMVATMPCKLTALRIRAGDTVMVNNARFGWSEKIFLVQELKFAIYYQGGAPALGVDLTLRATAADIWEGAQQIPYQTGGNPGLAAMVGADFVPVLQGSIPRPGDYADLIDQSTSPSGGLEFSTMDGSPSLIGYSEFANPSTPPAKYLTVRAIADREEWDYYFDTDHCAGSMQTRYSQQDGEFDIDPVTGVKTGSDTIVRSYGPTLHPTDIGHHVANSVCVFPILDKTTSTMGFNGGCCRGSEGDSFRLTSTSGGRYLSNEDTEDNAITRFINGASWSGWGIYPPVAAYQQRTGISWVWLKFKFRGSWINALPWWSYELQVLMEGRAYGTGDWVEEDTVTRSLSADPDGNMVLDEEIEVVATVGREKRIKSYTLVFDA